MLLFILFLLIFVVVVNAKETTKNKGEKEALKWIFQTRTNEETFQKEQRKSFFFRVFLVLKQYNADDERISFKKPFETLENLIIKFVLAWTTIKTVSEKNLWKSSKSCFFSWYKIVKKWRFPQLPWRCFKNNTIRWKWRIVKFTFQWKSFFYSVHLVLFYY